MGEQSEEVRGENIIKGSLIVGNENNYQEYGQLLEDEDVVMVESHEKDEYSKRKRLETQPVEQEVAQSLPKRTRNKTAKAAQYENYAELHAGRSKRHRSGDKVQVFGRKTSKKPRSDGEGERNEDEEASRKSTIPRGGP